MTEKPLPGSDRTAAPAAPAPVALVGLWRQSFMVTTAMVEGQIAFVNALYGFALGMADEAMSPRGPRLWRALPQGLGFFGGSAAVDAPQPPADADAAESPVAAAEADSPGGVAHAQAGPVGDAPVVAAPVESTLVEGARIALDRDQAGAPAVDRPKGIVRPRGGIADDLKMITGISARLEKILNDLGFFHFDQLAAWTPAQVEWIDTYTNSRGRVSRDAWIAQAGALAVGGRDEYVRRFGKTPRKT